jgi:hypothetical protein
MKRDLSESTINQYKYWLGKYKNLDINNPEKTMKYLLSRHKEREAEKNEKMSPSYIKTVLCAIIWKLRKEYYEQKIDRTESIAAYKKYIIRLAEITEKKEIDHRQNAENIPLWSFIIQKREEMLQQKKLKYHFVLSLYTYIPPRRLKDYLMLKVISKEEYANDPMYNYYVWDTNKFLFFNYKTKKSYHKQVILIPDDLKTIIMHYTKFSKMAFGERYFNNKTHHVLHNMLMKILGCGVDAVRHSFINEMYKHYKIPENKVMEKMAMSMGHSLQTHLRYRKYDPSKVQKAPGGVFSTEDETTVASDDETNGIFEDEDTMDGIDDLDESELDGITTFDKVSLV